MRFIALGWFIYENVDEARVIEHNMDEFVVILLVQNALHVFLARGIE